MLVAILGLVGSGRCCPSTTVTYRWHNETFFVFKCLNKNAQVLSVPAFFCHYTYNPFIPLQRFHFCRGFKIPKLSVIICIIPLFYTPSSHFKVFDPQKSNFHVQFLYVIFWFWFFKQNSVMYRESL